MASSAKSNHDPSPDEASRKLSPIDTTASPRAMGASTGKKIDSTPTMAVTTVRMSLTTFSHSAFWFTQSRTLSHHESLRSSLDTVCEIVDAAALPARCTRSTAAS